MNIYEKLGAIQKELKAPKSQFNSFAKFNYRNLEDILEAVKPLLFQKNLALTISDEIIDVGGRVYVKATATVFDMNSDEKVVNTACAREAANKKGMDDSQITGATSSYARKYCLNGLFCIDDTKDADSMDNSKKPAKKQGNTKANTMTSDQDAKIRSLCSENDLILAAVCKRYGITQKMTPTQFDNVFRILEKDLNAGEIEFDLVAGNNQ